MTNTEPSFLSLGRGFQIFTKYHIAALTNIINRNTKIRCCQALFSVNCWLANWSKKVIDEIQFNLQLLYPAVMN